MQRKGTCKKERTIGDCLIEMAEVSKRLRDFNEDYLRRNKNYRSMFEKMYPDIYRLQKEIKKED